MFRKPYKYKLRFIKKFRELKPFSQILDNDLTKPKPQSDNDETTRPNQFSN